LPEPDTGFSALLEHFEISPMPSGVLVFLGSGGTNTQGVSSRPHLLYNPFIPCCVGMDVLYKNGAANRVLCGHVAF